MTTAPLRDDDNLGLGMPHENRNDGNLSFPEMRL
jgi:hypothetical protein